MDRGARSGCRRWLATTSAVLATAALAACSMSDGTVARSDGPRPAASMLSGPVVVPGADPSEASGKPDAPQCVTSAAMGRCGPYEDSSLSLAGGKLTVGQDVWNPLPGWSQSLYATSPDSWYVVADMPAGNTAVISFPNVGDTFASDIPLSDFSAIYSSFAENMHAASDTKAWAAYDIWLNDWRNEVLIQNDYVDHGGCHFLATVTFGGTEGIPAKQWELCKYGQEIIWSLTDKEESGTVNILAILDWLVSKGDLPESSNLTGISYGWEICSTGSKPETFTLSQYTVTTSIDNLL